VAEPFYMIGNYFKSITCGAFIFISCVYEGDKISTVPWYPATNTVLGFDTKLLSPFFLSVLNL
jgi:hypothetical protein